MKCSVALVAGERMFAAFTMGCQSEFDNKDNVSGRCTPILITAILSIFSCSFSWKNNIPSFGIFDDPTHETHSASKAVVLLMLGADHRNICLLLSPSVTGKCARPAQRATAVMLSVIQVVLQCCQ